nr:MAG TPA: hypothetical protein [Caudoviricetes sp.]
MIFFAQFPYISSFKRSKSLSKCLNFVNFSLKMLYFFVFCQLSLIFTNYNAKNFSPGISYKTIAIMTLRVYNKV